EPNRRIVRATAGLRIGASAIIMAFQTGGLEVILKIHPVSTIFLAFWLRFCPRQPAILVSTGQPWPRSRTTRNTDETTLRAPVPGRPGAGGTRRPPGARPEGRHNNAGLHLHRPGRAPRRPAQEHGQCDQ